MGAIPCFMQSCSKKDSSSISTKVENSTLSIDTVTNLNCATAGSHFVLYSIVNDSIVPTSDSATTKWDIGFRATTIITNAGISGPGNGGAFIKTGTTLEDYLTIESDSTFKTDKLGSYAIPTGSGNGWYSYNPTTHIIVPIAGRILIIRTASGKYAKLEILSYYKNNPSSPTLSDPYRYYTFRYVYQKSGSKTFQ